MSSEARQHARLGLLVNPIAGMGGPVGLKGTDGPGAAQRALRLGARPHAGERARLALAALLARSRAEVIAAPGAMGGEVARALGLAAQTTGPDPGERTTARDTSAAAEEMARRGVDLLMFAGGDGTARDVYDAVGGEVPLVGVPTGVKMHSGVFASNPPAAGAVAASYLRSPSRDLLQPAEIADVDERAVRAGRVATRLYGSALVPREPRLMLGAKASFSGEDHGALDALCGELAQGMRRGALYLIGPGASTALLCGHLGVQGTLLGVDAVRDGALVGADLAESDLLALLGEHPDASLICGVVGGQGALFGRGNQQLSAKVLRRIGRERITVIAGERKLLRLDPPVLRVDTGEDRLDDELRGHIRVQVAPGRTMMMRVDR